MGSFCDEEEEEELGILVVGCIGFQKLDLWCSGFWTFWVLELGFWTFGVLDVWGFGTLGGLILGRWGVHFRTFLGSFSDIQGFIFGHS